MEKMKSFYAVYNKIYELQQTLPSRASLKHQKTEDEIIKTSTQLLNDLRRLKPLDPENERMLEIDNLIEGCMKIKTNPYKFMAGYTRLVSDSE